jgi:predicted transposase YbfD/YdcC
VLGQVKVSEKSNEIVAIPALLDMMSIEGRGGDDRCDGLPARHRIENHREKGRRLHHRAEG